MMKTSITSNVHHEQNLQCPLIQKLNLTQQLELEIQLKEVKTAYGEMILKSYKTKSGKNRLMFLLSSETFFQAFKRMQYMKQYAAFRKILDDQY